ncbi:MAG: 3TM-type holin [Pseudomonadota bacterium]
MLIKPITDMLGKVIDGVIPDQNEAARIKAKILAELMAHEGAELEAKMKIVLAEAQGESWLQRNWRPVLMLTIVAIVANNYLFAPYLAAMGLVSIQLDLPDRLWDLMTLGVGGYVVGRSAEKTVKAWRVGEHG